MKKEQEKTSGIHKFWTAVGTILCIVLIPILIINCTLIVKSYTNKDEVPSVGGIFPMIILTDSMDPEFKSGDLIICKNAKAEDVKEGDIICFFDPTGNGTTTVTHRVTEVTRDESGDIAWVTKGDANNTEDETVVLAKNLVGIYEKSFSGIGNVAMFMQTTQGLIICVICPIILLVVYDIIRRRMYEKEKKKDTDALMEELKALRAEKEQKENE